MRGWIGMVAVVALAAGCGGSAASSEEASGSGETSGAEATSGAAHVAFRDMTPEQRGEYMHDVVVPTMRELFQAQDPERFANFSCRTCHGENAREVNFHMPNGLHPLTHEQIEAAFQSEEPMAVFMTRQVWPRMGELLGEPLYNPETREGFSCMNCHASAE